jgi:hypothetical protein
MVFIEPWQCNIDIKIVKPMKQASSAKIFFTIVHNPPWLSNLFGFIENQNERSLQKGIGPS